MFVKNDGHYARFSQDKHHFPDGRKKVMQVDYHFVNANKKVLLCQNGL